MTERARRDGVPPDAVRVIALLTTEAVANAVEHGPADGEIDVEVHRLDGGLRVAVRDASHSPPVLHEVPPTAPGGRGIMLIDTLSERWGVEYHRDGTKTVWFEVPA